MFKKILFLFCALFILSNAYAQDKARVNILGKKKGSVSIVKENGIDYVEARKLAKILKMKTSWFGKSGQLNMSAADGYFCVLRDENIFASVNGGQERLSFPPVVRDKDLYVPLDFFEYGSLPKALGYDIGFASGVITVEKYSGEKAPPLIPAAQPDSLSSPSVLQEQEPQVLEDDFFESVARSSVVPVGTEISASAPKTVIKRLEPSVTSIDKTASKKGRKFRVIIDAGHGGKDSGAVRSAVREKDINLKVSKMVYAILNKEKNIDVKLTRGDDTFIALKERAQTGNSFKADIFVSIHANAAKRVSANGFEVYFRSDKASDAEAAATAALENEALNYEGKGGEGLSFADLLLKSLAVNEYMNESSKLASHVRNAVSKNQRSLGLKVFDNSSIKQANFYVLKWVESPSILVEMGYLSNSNDRKRLNSAAVQKKMAEYISDGILSYAKAEGWK